MLSGAALAVSGVLLQNVLNNALAAPNDHRCQRRGGLCRAVFARRLSHSHRVFAVCSIPWRSFRVAAHLCRRGKACFPHNDHPRGRGLKQCFHRRQQRHRTYLYRIPFYNSSSFFIGGFSGIAYKNLTPAWIAILLGLLLAVLFSGEMDVLSLGDETAQSLGMRVQGTRFLLLMTASLLAGGAVSFSGLLASWGSLYRTSCATSSAHATAS